MLSYLYKILIGQFGCKHYWDVLNTETIKTIDGSSWTRYHLRCNNCGNIKVKDMGIRGK